MSDVERKVGGKPPQTGLSPSNVPSQSARGLPYPGDNRILALTSSAGATNDVALGGFVFEWEASA